MKRGVHRIVWNHGDTGLKRVASGVYLYRVVIGGQSFGGKLVVVR
jgi:hypothetical protein